jgi:thiol-disulfide isomerase/thioredoxin
MKKISLLAILVTFGVLSHAVYADPGYKISFEVAGVQDSMCYLGNYFGNKQYIQDSAKADSEGKFVFSGEEALPGGIYLIVMPAQKYFELLIDKDQEFDVKTTYQNPVNSLEVSGSTDNEDFYKYMRFVENRGKQIQSLKAQHTAATDKKEKDEISKKMGVIDTEVLDFRKNFINEKSNSLLAQLLKVTIDIEIPDAPKNADGSIDSTFAYRYYKAHYFDNLDLRDDRMVRTPVFHPKIEQYMTKLTPQVPDSIIASADVLIGKLDPKSEIFRYIVWWITNHYETSKYMGMDAVFVHMAKKYYNKETAYWIDDAQLYKIKDRAKVLEPILIGKKVRNLTLTDTSNVFQSLHNVHANYTILYFWDPDCGHCKTVTPLLKEYYEKIKSKGVEVYAVCTEIEIDKWKNYIKENELEWINVADPKLTNNFRHEFDITSTPQIFLLDKDKKIVAKRIEVETLEQIVTMEMEK